MKKEIEKKMVAAAMAITSCYRWKPFIKSTNAPQQTQNKLLLEILRRNRNTVFGQQHGFAKIKSYQQFKDFVPVNHYEDLRTYIDKQEIEKKCDLNSTQPIMYTLTSGTTSEPKRIPVLKRSLANFRGCQSLAAYAVFKSFPNAFLGKILALASPAQEGVLATGTAFGSMSGFVYQSMPGVLRSKYVVPPPVFAIKNYEEKYFSIAALSASTKNITMIAAANPSTLLKLHSVVNRESEQLIHAVSLSNPKRAQELQKLRNTRGSLEFFDLWPNLAVVATWTGGSCAYLIPSLKKKLPRNCHVVELGYHSSEFRGGIVIDATNNIEVPAIHDNFFEFVEKDLWEQGQFQFLTLDQVCEGKQYYIFATTQSGLYRYDINDIVEVTGRFNNTPTIRFVQKGKGVINLTGEKLYENQVVLAVRRLAEERNIDIPFFIMLACPEALEYTLYVEHEPCAVAHLESYLRAVNLEFDDKCRSGRLKPLRVIFLRAGAGDAYKQHCLQLRQREAQFKVSHLQYRDQCDFDFTVFVIPSDSSLAESK